MAVRGARPGRVLALAIVVGLAAWLLGARALGTFEYVVFADRDLVRGARFLVDLPHTGAELGGGPGARVPGAMLGLTFWAAGLFGGAHAVFVAQAALASVSVLVLFFGLRLRLGTVAAAVAAAVWGTHAAQLQTVRVLWNPGFLPLFLCVGTVALVRIVVDRDLRALPVWAGAVAVGAQFHVSILLWAFGCLPVLAGAGLRRWRVPLRRSLGVVLVVMAPYLVGELVRGGENTRALLSQPEVGGATWRLGLDRVPIVIDALVGGFGPRWSYGRPELLRVVQGVWAVPLVAALAGFLVACARVPLRRVRTEDRVQLAVGVPVLVGAGLTVLSVSSQVEVRYLLALVPSAAVGAGVAAAATARLLGQVGPWGQAAGVALLLPPLVVRAGPALDAGRAMHGAGSYSTLTALLARAEAVSGWSLDALAARTVWVSLGADGGVRRAQSGPAIEHLLRARGATFEGSGDAPCALVVAHPMGHALQRLMDPAVVFGAVGMQPEPGSLRVDALDREHSLVRYDREGRCPSSMYTRYLPTEAEVALRPLWGVLRDGEVRALPSLVGQRFAFAVRHTEGAGDGDDKLVAALDLVPHEGGTAWTLHSSQLRGSAGNTGAWQTVVLRDPVLSFEREGERVTVTVEPGLVGGNGVLVPLGGSVDLAPGRWTVALEGGIHGPGLQGWPPESEARAFRVSWEVDLPTPRPPPAPATTPPVR